MRLKSTLISKAISKVVITTTIAVSLTSTVFAEQVLFENVNIFNGTENKIYKNHNVLVEDNLIKAISKKSIKAESGATVIDGKGKTLMPGLIEAHAHLMLMGPSLPLMESNTTWEDFAIHGAAIAYQDAVLAEPLCNTRKYILDGKLQLQDSSLDGELAHIRVRKWASVGE